MWLEVSGLNLWSVLPTQKLLVKSWRGICLVDTIDRGSVALCCILMLQLDDVIPSSCTRAGDGDPQHKSTTPSAVRDPVPALKEPGRFLPAASVLS